MLPARSVHRQNGVVTFHTNGTLPISEAVACYATILANPGNYPRIVRRFLEGLLPVGGSITDIAFQMYAAGKKSNLVSPVKKFMHFARTTGLARVIPDPPAAKLPPAANAYILAFLADQTNLRGEHSKATYLTALNSFFAFLPEESLLYSAQTVDSYVRHLNNEDKSPFTVNSYLSAVKQFTKWLLKRRELLRLELSPRQVEQLREVADVRGLPIEGNRFYKEDLSEEERATLLEGILDPKVKAMVALMAYCGLRTVELTRLKVSDVDLARKRIQVLGKGQSTKRAAKLFTPAADAVKSYISSLPPHGGDGYLFSGLTTRMVRYHTDKYLKEMDLKRAGVSAHSLRHTAAQRLLDKGADLLHVKNQLGHKHLSTTQVYVEKQAQQKYLDSLPE
jgi:integrase/recombinase XerC